MSKKRLTPNRSELIKTSQEKKRSGGITLAGARMIAENLNHGQSEFLKREIVSCNITKVFHAPVNWPAEHEGYWIRISGATPEYSATLTSDPARYLKNASILGQYDNDPDLREKVEGFEGKHGKGSSYLVIEESGQVGECVMDHGECWKNPDELGGGVLIFEIPGRPWPKFSEKTDRDVSLLTSMRIRTRVSHPFELYARSVLFITAYGEPAHALNVQMSISYGGLRVTKRIPDGDLSKWADDTGHAAERLRVVSTDSAIQELLAATRLDEAKDDEYFRLWYLRLWQAIDDISRYCSMPDVKRHIKKLKGGERWIELTNHRIAIAHWHTARVDFGKVQDLHNFAIELSEHILQMDARSIPKMRPTPTIS